MSTLINKIEQLIKREKTTPDRQNKDDSKKTSAELLTELFGVFNADPPKISEKSKKSKKSKKKHKKEKKKRSRSSSPDSDESNSHKRKKRKKERKLKKRKRSVSSESSGIRTPPTINLQCSELTEQEIKVEITKEEKQDEVPIKTENIPLPMDPSDIPMPDSPESEDTKQSVENDKGKNKIQIKNLKFSTVFEETVKQAEAAAKKKAESQEEGEYTDSSSNSDELEPINSQFPKSSDLGGIMKKNDENKSDDKNKLKDSKTHDSRRSPRRKSRDRSKSKRSRSRSRKRHSSRSHYESSSKRRRSRSRKRSSSRTRRRSSSRSKRRSSSRSKRRSSSRSKRRSNSRSGKSHSRHSPRHSRVRSPTGVRLADSEKKRLLEVARRNAINMLKNGAVPAGAAALPLHTRNQVMAAIHSGGKSVDELTDFCKHLSKKEALGELSSVSEDDGLSENEDTMAFHHPFLVKEKAPIVMNIRGGAPLPIKSATTVNKEELRMQFPVSSGSEHRQSQWTPVDPPAATDNDNTQIVKLNQPEAPKPVVSSVTPATIVEKSVTPSVTSEVPVSSPVAPLPPPPLPPALPQYLTNFNKTNNDSPIVPPLPPPGPQAYPPSIERARDITAVIAEKLSSIRREQENNERKAISYPGYGAWGSRNSLGQFTGSTGAQILTPRELASGTQAWAKKDQLTRAAPVAGGMGMALLQKMGWTPGQGLGKEGTGTLQPLLLEVKLDTKGLQAKEETAKRGSKGGRGNINRRPNQGGNQSISNTGNKHPVSLLGEYCSKQKVGPPEYNLCFECGPDHKKNFLFKVKVAGVEYQPAVASANKKQAKADAASLALQKLGINIPA